MMRKICAALLYWLGMIWLWLVILFINQKVLQEFKIDEESWKAYMVYLCSGCLMSSLLDIFSKYRKK